jgi:glycerol-3-phosphate acyltransferase PlsY
MVSAVFIIVLGYLLGSVPFGLIAGHMKGMDIRHHGSGNIGATNVFRVLGRGWGIAVFACDAAKGYLAVVLAMYLNAHFREWCETVDFVRESQALPPLGAQILGGIWAIIGHTFPCWLGFKGGKGVATSLGVVIALVPFAASISLVVWVVSVIITRFVSVASILASLTVPLVVAFQPASADKWPLFTLCIVAAFLIVWRHRPNIHRLFHGTEHRVGKPKPTIPNPS